MVNIETNSELLRDLDGVLIELHVPLEADEHGQYGVSTIGRVQVSDGDMECGPHISIGRSTLPSDTLVVRDWRFVRDYYILLY